MECPPTKIKQHNIYTQCKIQAHRKKSTSTVRTTWNNGELNKIKLKSKNKIHEKTKFNEKI